MTELDRLALAVQLPGFAGTSLDPEVETLLEEGLGGVCLFGSNTDDGPEALAALTAAMRAANRHAVVAIDEEGGDVTRVHARTGSPVLGAAALGRVDDLALTADTGHAIGSELAALGITLDLAPCADVNTDPDNPVIGVRSFGAEPHPAARHVAAWVSGLQSAGVSACVKHFPGHGDTGQDSHLAVPVVEAGMETLAIRELVPFRAAVEAGVDAVMTSHLVVAAVDALPATLSRPVLSLLRQRLGFAGVIVSDALDMAGASAGRGIPRAAVEALAAGCDLLCLGADKDLALVRDVQAAIVAAVRAGELPAARLVDAAERGAALGSRAPSPAPVAAADQVAAAHLALRLDGEPPDLATARTVRIETVANIAVGEVPWGLPGEPVEDEDAWRLSAEERTLVVQVREAHRRPGASALLQARADAGLPTLLLEWGWPGPLQAGVPRLCTYGASVPSSTAAAEVLGSRGWTP